MSTPKVSIGMPVYNSSPFIRQALDSLLNQTFTDFELIISDNASTDETESICREYAAKDPRIRYVRQPENRGALLNFQFVLDEAVGAYFMWAAADDMWLCDFIDKNLDFLEKTVGYVGAMVSSSYGKDSDKIRSGCIPIVGNSRCDRAIQFMRNPGANSRFYGLFKIASIKQIVVSNYCFLGGDWAIILELLKDGNIGLSTDVICFYKIPVGLSSNIVKLCDSYRTSIIEYLIPFWFLTQYIMFSYNCRSVEMLITLVRFNLSFFWHYWSMRLKMFIARLNIISDRAVKI